jgi:hypothetical protein
MSSPEKPIPPADLSLKFIAWNIKEISQSIPYLKDVAVQLTMINERLGKLLGQKPVEKVAENSHNDIPF